MLCETITRGTAMGLQNEAHLTVSYCNATASKSTRLGFVQKTGLSTSNCMKRNTNKELLPTALLTDLNTDLYSEPILMGLV